MRSASRAKTKPSTMSGGVVRIVNQMVCHSASQNSLLVSASV